MGHRPINILNLKFAGKHWQETKGHEIGRNQREEREGKKERMFKSVNRIKMMDVDT